MVILNALHRLALLVEGGDPALQAGVAAPAVAGEHFDAVDGGEERPCTRRWSKALPRQLAVDVDQDALERVEIEAAQAVAQHIVAEPARSLDPAL